MVRLNPFLRALPLLACLLVAVPGGPAAAGPPWGHTFRLVVIDAPARRHGPSFGGSYPRRQMDNSFFTFRAGGVRRLVVTLKYDPTTDEVAWADRVVRGNPRHQVIVVTYEYQRGESRTAIGERVWNALGRRYPNTQFVLSGHYTRVGTRADTGDAGNLVYQIQADYQTYSIPRVDNNSYLRVMDFDTAAGTVAV